MEIQKMLFLIHITPIVANKTVKMRAKMKMMIK
jgi:hypothetical protein